MYGFRDQLNAIPLTRFRATLHGSSRYSARTSDMIEHTFDGRSMSYDPASERRTDDPFPRAAGSCGPDPPECLLRGGRVRARHLPPNTDSRARARREPAGEG